MEALPEGKRPWNKEVLNARQKKHLLTSAIREPYTKSAKSYMVVSLHRGTPDP